MRLGLGCGWRSCLVLRVGGRGGEWKGGVRRRQEGEGEGGERRKDVRRKDVASGRVASFLGEKWRLS